MDNADINGRIESFDQSVRSLDRRLRAVERRLSGSNDEIQIIEEDPQIDQDLQELHNTLQEFGARVQGLNDELALVKSNDLVHVQECAEQLKHEISGINNRMDEFARVQTSINEDASASVDSMNSTFASEIESLKAELEATKQRLHRQENMNKISIGSFKVPIELSGIIASLALVITGYLVWANRWDVIRSVYYPTGLAVLFAAVVIVKFILTNRQPENL